MPTKAMSSLRWSSRDQASSSSSSVSKLNGNTGGEGKMMQVSSRLSYYDDDQQINGVTSSGQSVDDDYIGIVDVSDDALNMTNKGNAIHKKTIRSVPIKVTVAPANTPPSSPKSTKSEPPAANRASFSSQKKPSMIQLAVGIRMDSETLDQALHVAEVAARIGGDVLKAFVTTSSAEDATSFSIVKIKVENAINAILDQSDLGFDVHLRCRKDVSAWNEGGPAAENVEAELSRAPTWLVNGLCGEASANGKVTRNTVVSVGLAVGLVPAVGVVYDPFQEEVFTARVGEEAKLNGKSLHLPTTVISNTSNTHQPVDISVSTNISAPDEHEAVDYRDHCAATIKNLMKQGVYKIQIGGSPAKSIVDVAVGRVSGYFECGPKASDVCAALVIAKCTHRCVANINAAKQKEDKTTTTLSRRMSMKAKPAQIDEKATFDVNCRRFICASTPEVQAVVLQCIAWPIPYLIRDEEHPLGDDAADEFESFQVYDKVLSQGGDDTESIGVGSLRRNSDGGRRVGGIPSKHRWSDRPASSENEAVEVDLTPILVPKSNLHLFRDLKRQVSAPIIEVDELIPALKPPQSRREREIELHCVQQEKTIETETPTYYESIDQPAGFSGNRTEEAKNGWNHTRANGIEERRRREIEIKMADDRASLILDRALGLETDTDSIYGTLDTDGVEVTVPIKMSAGVEVLDEFDDTAKQVEDAIRLQDSVRTAQIKSMVSESLMSSSEFDPTTHGFAHSEDNVYEALDTRKGFSTGDVPEKKWATTHDVGFDSDDLYGTPTTTTTTATTTLTNNNNNNNNNNTNGNTTRGSNNTVVPSSYNDNTSDGMDRFDLNDDSEYDLSAQEWSEPSAVEQEWRRQSQTSGLSSQQRDDDLQF